MKIPEEIRKLSDDLIWAFYDLDEFKIIFTDDPNGVRLLNDTAPTFFTKLVEYYWNRFILSISRFTDPSKQGQFENLSIDVLEKIASQAGMPDLQQLSEKIRKIKKEAVPIKKFRSKYIAHRDLERAVITDLKQETIYLEQVEMILKDMGDCINLCLQFFKAPPILFGQMSNPRGARSLMYYLRQGAIYAELKEKRRDLLKDEEEESSSSY